KYPKYNVDQANEEQETLVEILRQSAIDILEIDVEERHPTSPFFDDTAVKCNSPDSEASARHEGAEISIDGAALEGSDVLFTGKEIIVASRAHTNEAGATCVAKTFARVPGYHE
uniref:Dimethylargininase n=1 Tax=Macrostomum lignano TaxID=282301 RepID=A0A1I8FM23_9PLAT